MMWWNKEKRVWLAIMTAMVVMLATLFSVMPAYAEAAELTVTDITVSSFKVSWPAADKANKYDVEVSKTVGGKVYETTVTDLECMVGGLEPRTSYDVIVNARPVKDAAWEGGVKSLQKTGITTLTPAFVLFAEITTKGDISLTFNQAMADPSGTQDQFEVKVNGSDVQVKKVETTNTDTKIKLVVEPTVAAGSNVVITYTSDGNLKSADGVAINSFVVRIGAQAPALAADTTENLVGQRIDITFTPDSDWMNAITGVTVNGTSISGEKYTISDGVIAIEAEVFSSPGEYNIVVQADGYSDTSVKQIILADQAPAGGLVVFQKPYALATEITKGVGIEGEFEVGFTEQIKPNSLTISINKTGTLKGPLPEKVPVAFTYDLTANNTVEIKTDNPLDYGTCYELMIGSGLEGVSSARTDADSKVEFCTVAFDEPTYKITRDGQEVTTVAVGQAYKLEAILTNCSDQKQSIDAVLQLRGGKGARDICGGYILTQYVKQIDVKKGEPTTVTLEFTVPSDLDSFYLYGDIFVWEKNGSSANALPFHFSCPVE